MKIIKNTHRQTTWLHSLCFFAKLSHSLPTQKQAHTDFSFSKISPSYSCLIISRLVVNCDSSFQAGFKNVPLILQLICPSATTNILLFHPSATSWKIFMVRTVVIYISIQHLSQKIPKIENYLDWNLSITRYFQVISICKSTSFKHSSKSWTWRICQWLLLKEST